MQDSGNVVAGPSAGKWIVVAFMFVFGLSGQLFAKPAGCPCSPCTCSPCTCGGGGGSSGKSGKHHHEKDHAGGVAVGGTVDLGGVGKRHREADPFAVGGGSSNTPHTQEKHVATTKKHEHEGGTTNDPFRDVHLTGSQAKAVAQGGTTPAHD
jgi:hypothetical protein